MTVLSLTAGATAFAEAAPQLRHAALRLRDDLFQDQAAQHLKGVVQHAEGAVALGVIVVGFLGLSITTDTVKGRFRRANSRVNAKELRPRNHTWGRRGPQTASSAVT